MLERQREQVSDVMALDELGDLLVDEIERADDEAAIFTASFLGRCLALSICQPNETDPGESPRRRTAEARARDLLRRAPQRLYGMASIHCFLLRFGRAEMP